MQSKKKTETFIAVTAFLAVPLCIADPSWAFGAGRPWWHALTAPFIHTSVFHLAVNLWALWALWPSRRDAATAYVLCCLAGLLLSHGPLTLGLSGLLFAVVGLRFTFTRNNCLFMAVVLLLGFLPGLAGAYHLISFALGLAVRGHRQLTDYAERYGF